jgi:putative oxidoreductase
MQALIDEVPMTSVHSDWSANRDYVAPALAFRVAGGGVIWLAARAVLGGLFLMGGLGKFAGIDQFAASLVKNGIPENLAPMLAWLGAGVETVGGFMIVFGIATSWASLGLIAFTIAATFIAHRFWDVAPEARSMQVIQLQKNMMITAAFCFLYVAGGGPYSVDRWRRFR